MEQRPSASVAFGCIGIAAAMWLVVCAPIAAGITASLVSFWMLASFPEIAVTAAVLGGVQGLWFYLAGPGRSRSEYDGYLWLGAISGSFLGVLGFPPVFSRAGIIAARPTVAVFLVAAVLGGVAAGLVSAHVLTLLLQGRTLKLGRRVVLVGLIILTAIDYHFYWPATTERIAPPNISHQEITDLSAGNARGSKWSGCYEYEVQYPIGTGFERGQLKVVQTDGVLKVEYRSWFAPQALSGGVDRSGHFRFGTEVSTGQYPSREMWQGKFHGNSLEFQRRITLLKETNNLPTTQLIGTAHLTPCFP